MKEIVSTLADAEGLSLAPLIIVDELNDYLFQHGLLEEAEADLHFERIGEGHSNITYLITAGDQKLVLRRGPRPPLPPTTHDMIREAKIQRALKPLDVKTPEILDVCDDESLLGVPFYVMEYLDGHVITNTVPKELDTAVAKPSIAYAAVDALIALHNADISTGDIATIGKPDGYLRRQVERFAGLWPKISQRDLPEVQELASWLLANLPETQRSTVVHGDFRIGNLMFEKLPDASGRAQVKAILDWEMATLGDPLADLGYFLATYSDGDHTPTPLDLTPITRPSEFPSREDLAAHYAKETGANLDNLHWYQALALWKAAVFTEAIYQRSLRGEKGDAEFIGVLEQGVPLLLKEALKNTR